MLVINKKGIFTALGILLIVLLGVGIQIGLNKNNQLSESNATNQSFSIEKKIETENDQTKEINISQSSESTIEIDQSEYDAAAKEGEHKESAFDVELKDGTTVVAEDIANARHAMMEAGINDTFYSDKDIADLIQKSSTSSLDIVTVAKEYEKSKN